MTKKKSMYDETLANLVQEVGSSPHPALREGETPDELELRIKGIEAEHQVPRKVAEVMAETGYSKGTAHRIVFDRTRKEMRAREAAEAQSAAA